ncbi:MAG: GIY-YIG nuclease family protein, partial [Patescibacteria group bacterium]
SFYVGCTNDLEKRLKQHNSAKSGAHYTKLRRPVDLVHHEAFATLAQARAREAMIKQLSREQKQQLIALASLV